jgi:hypothetical protein
MKESVNNHREFKVTLILIILFTLQGNYRTRRFVAGRRGI